MKKAVIIILSVLIILPLLVAGGSYLVISNQYKDVFMPGLVINNVYATDLTVDEVCEKLSASQEMPEMLIVDKEGTKHTFSLDKIGYKIDYKAEVQKIKDEQSVLAFVKWFFDSSEKLSKDKTVEPVYSYEAAALDTYLDSLDYLKDNSDPKGKRVEVLKDRLKGYYLLDETTALLSHDKAVNAIQSAIDEREFEVDLVKADCYVKAEHTKDMEDALALWKDLSRYMDTVIHYECGNTKKDISAARISELIAVDEDGELLFDDNGKVYLDEKKVKELTEEICDMYNTISKPRTFKATRGDLVTIDSGTYGTKIDDKKEYEFLMGALGNGREMNRTPDFRQTTFSGLTGLDDIGDTYIEVDMSNQMMYYYVDGRRVIDTPVVTGNTSLNRGTPQKVAFVYMKQRNRTLRGEGYASFVNYWMPVYKGVGIHDSNWRGKYGGTIYKTNGSHGCINTPIDVVSKLYDMVEVGTPVLLFY